MSSYFHFISTKRKPLFPAGTKRLKVRVCGSGRWARAGLRSPRGPARGFHGHTQRLHAAATRRCLPLRRNNELSDQPKGEAQAHEVLPMAQGVQSLLGRNAQPGAGAFSAQGEGQSARRSPHVTTVLFTFFRRTVAWPCFICSPGISN